MLHSINVKHVVSNRPHRKALMVSDMLLFMRSEQSLILARVRTEAECVGELLTICRQLLCRQLHVMTTHIAHSLTCSLPRSLANPQGDSVESHHPDHLAAPLQGLSLGVAPGLYDCGQCRAAGASRAACNSAQMCLLLRRRPFKHALGSR